MGNTGKELSRRAGAIARAGLALAILAGTGCVSRDRTQKDLSTHWNAVAQPPWETFKADPNGKREMVFQGIAVKDYEYQRYTHLIRRGVTYGGFGVETATIGLTTAGTLASAGATRILSGIAASLTGSAASFNKNVLFDQSISTFISKMDALRLTKLAEIQGRLEPERIGTYSWAEAYRDVQDYGRLGSLDAAFSDVGKTAGKEQEKATETIGKLKGTQ